MSSPLLARSGLSLDRLASFVAIAEAGGLSAAAQGDPVRQSQLSRQLKELEEFFGATLIERRRGVFRLTAAGRALIDIARPTLTRLEAFERRCGGQSTEIHLGAGESVLVWLLTPKLKPLLVADPQLALTLHNLQSEEIVSRLRDGRLDFGVLRRSAVGAGLLSLPAGAVEYALFIPRAAFPQAQPATAAQLLAQVPVAVLEGTSTVSAALSDWAAENRVRLNIRLRCTSLVQAAAAVKGLGMAAVLPVWAQLEFSTEAVTCLSLPVLRDLATPLRLVWTRRQAAIRPFLGSLGRNVAAALAG
jgi:DNA-binding transcriptional LysR family regulator